VSGNNVGGNPVVTGSSTTQTSPGATIPSSSNGGLSTGAKIGIGVSIPLLVIILAILAYFLLRRRRRQKSSQISRSNLEPPSNEQDHNEYKSELPGNKLGIAGGRRYPGKSELDSIVASTLPAAELDHQNVAHNIAYSNSHQRSGVAELERQELSPINNPTELDTTSYPQEQSHPIASPNPGLIPQKQIPHPCRGQITGLFHPYHSYSLQ
jgi:hypothetical protein